MSSRKTLFPKQKLDDTKSNIPCPIPRSTKSSRARLSHIKSLCKPAIQMSPLVRISSIVSTKGKNIKTADDIPGVFFNKSNQVNENASKDGDHKGLAIYEKKKNEFFTIKKDFIEKQTGIKEVHAYLKQLHNKISNISHNPGNSSSDLQFEEISNSSKLDIKTFHIKPDEREQNYLFEMFEYMQELMKTVTELTQFCHEVIKNYSGAIDWIQNAATDGNLQHIDDKITEWKVNVAELEKSLLTITADSDIHLSEVKKSIENLSQKVQNCISMVTITNTKYNELRYKCAELEDIMNRTEGKLHVKSNSLDAQPRTEQDDISEGGLDTNSASSKSSQLISLEKDEIMGCINLSDGEFTNTSFETTISTTNHTEKGVNDKLQSNEKLVLELQDQISNLKTNLILSENSIKMFRKKIKHPTMQSSSDQEHCNEDLYQEIKSLQAYLAEIQTQNNNLSKEIENKNTVILQNEKDIDEQHMALNVRKGIIEQLKLHERELTEQMKILHLGLAENNKKSQVINNFTALNSNETENMCLKIKKQETDLDPLEKCIAAIQKQQKHAKAKNAERSEPDIKSSHRWRFGFL